MHPSQLILQPQTLQIPQLHRPSQLILQPHTLQIPQLHRHSINRTNTSTSLKFSINLSLQTPIMISKPASSSRFPPCPLGILRNIIPIPFVLNTLHRTRSHLPSPSPKPLLPDSSTPPRRLRTAPCGSWSRCKCRRRRQ